MLVHGGTAPRPKVVQSGDTLPSLQYNGVDTFGEMWVRGDSCELVDPASIKIEMYSVEQEIRDVLAH